jgi:LysR family pca operon transcriptional activator
MQINLQERLRIRDLALIDAVSRERSLVGASRRLAQSQPATTKALKLLETYLGVKLFERTPRGVEPTEPGALMCESAARILREVKALDLAFSDLGSARARVMSIGAECGTADAVVTSAIAAFECGGIEVRVIDGSCEDLIDELCESRLDLVVGRLVSRADDVALLARPLYDEPLALMARSGHPMFSEPVPNRDLFARFPAIVHQRTGQVAQEIDTFLRQELSPAQRPVRSTSVALVREMVHLSDFVAIGPVTMMAGDIERGAVRIVRTRDAVAARPAGLIGRRDDRALSDGSPFVAAFQASAAKVTRLLAA